MPFSFITRPVECIIKQTTSHKDPQPSNSFEIKKHVVKTSTIAKLYDYIFANSIVREVLPSSVLSLLGLILAGEMLNQIQHWKIFKTVPELFILVPILLGLKGNLEMTLAARLSTASNLGLLDPTQKNALTPLKIIDKIFYSLFSITRINPGNILCDHQMDKEDIRWMILFGNFGVTQVQALVIGFSAGLWSWVLGGFEGGMVNLALCCSCGIICGAVSMFVLSAFLIWMVILCRSYKVDPDNMAIPVAASLGDFMTVLMLAFCGWFYEFFDGSGDEISYWIIFISFISTLFWVSKIHQNKYVKDVMSDGWIPIFISVFLSSIAGLALEKYITEFESLSLLVPVINGITGNIASIYASRFSTSLHKQKNEYPSSLSNDEYDENIDLKLIAYDSNIAPPSGMQYVNIVKEVVVKNTRQPSSSYTDVENKSFSFVSVEDVKIYDQTTNSGNSPTNITVSQTQARLLEKENKLAFWTLLWLSVVIGWVFLIFVWCFDLANIKMDVLFFTAYSIVNFVLTYILLYMAHHFTAYFWSKGLDPDSLCLPYLTAVADVAGTLLMVWALMLIKNNASTVTQQITRIKNQEASRHKELEKTHRLIHRKFRLR